MKYLVNSFSGSDLSLPSIYPNNYIGLFRDCKWEGRGNFCGWYGAEYYINTELLAYYKSEGHIYRPEKRISDVYECTDIVLREICIGSSYWEYIIEADSDAEAIEKFKNAQWIERKG